MVPYPSVAGCGKSSCAPPAYRCPAPARHVGGKSGGRRLAGSAGGDKVWTTPSISWPPSDNIWPRADERYAGGAVRNRKHYPHRPGGGLMDGRFNVSFADVERVALPAAAPFPELKPRATASAPTPSSSHSAKGKGLGHGPALTDLKRLDRLILKHKGVDRQQCQQTPTKCSSSRNLPTTGVTPGDDIRRRLVARAQRRLYTRPAAVNWTPR